MPFLTIMNFYNFFIYIENFEHEKQLLLEELASLKQENVSLKGRSEILNSECGQIQTNLEMHHQELRKSKDQFSHLDAQVSLYGRRKKNKLTEKLVF